MSDLHIAGKAFYARGIDGIIQGEQAHVASLPELLSLPPTTQPGGPSHLERLLRVPSFDDVLEAALRPSIADPDLLRPGSFTRALDAAYGVLQAHQQRCAATSPAHAGILEQAIALLSEEQALRELAHRYQAALYAA